MLTPMTSDYNSEILNKTLKNLKIPDRVNGNQALRTTNIGDPKHFTKYERNLEKSPIDYQEQTLRSTMNIQDKVK